MPAPHREVRVLAPAKINLILRVLDRRPDGYHNLWSLMQTVGLEDELRVRIRSGTAGVRLTCSLPDLPTDGRNLVVKAASLLLSHVARAIDVEIELTKRIPLGGGLGGGSSDAAATMIALNGLLDLGWPLSKLADMSAGLGSDVPFFFSAPTAIVAGRGGDVTPVSLAGGRWIVLVHPGFPSETKQAYQALSARRAGVRPLSPAHERIGPGTGLSWDDVIPHMENDFEPALAPAYPILTELTKELLHAGAEAAMLSGSGATVFGVFRDEPSAREGCRTLGRRPGCFSAAVPSGRRPIECEDV